MKKKLVFICIIIFSFSACKKQVEKERSEFIGEWHSSSNGSESQHLTISENSKAVFTFHTQDGDHDYKGIARANNRHLKIGRINYFDIIEYPHKIDTAIEHLTVPFTGKIASWKMVLEGMKPEYLHRTVKYTFYRSDY